MPTVRQFYKKAFRSGREVQIKEHSGEEVDGRAIWNELENETKELKDVVLLTLDSSHILQYNESLKPIYEEMKRIIARFGMDISEFDPKSNHFFCQLMNLVDKKSAFQIKLNKIMQLGFNAGQLSVFIERNTLPDDRRSNITEFILRNKMLDLDTYVDPETQEIINSRYLRAFKVHKLTLKKKHSRRRKQKSSKNKSRAN
jgi:hypothetical protein